MRFNSRKCDDRDFNSKMYGLCRSPCNLGLYGSFTQVECQTCPEGRFSDKIGELQLSSTAIPCKECPAGWRQKDDPTQCEECTKGNYADQTARVNCKYMYIVQNISIINPGNIDISQIPISSIPFAFDNSLNINIVIKPKKSYHGQLLNN